MPINERSGLSIRQAAISDLRHRLTERGEEEMQGTRPIPNSFAVDYATETVIDINNPPSKRYIHQAFPQILYKAENGNVQTALVEDQAAANKKLAKGWMTAADYRQYTLKQNLAKRVED